MKDLAGKTAVVTGAASGIGRAMSLRWAAAGMNVVMGDVDDVALAAAVEEVDALTSAASLHVDVSELADVESLLDLAIERYGRAHLVCNNAGVGGPAGRAPHELEIEDWRWVLEVDLWGVIHGAKVFVPHLLEHGDGHVVNTASQSGLTTGSVISPAYYAAKHAVVAISECQYHDLAKRDCDVGVSVLCPGAVASNFMHDERHRPERLRAAVTSEPDPAAEAVTAAMADVLAGGMAPEQVAAIVHDAVVDGEFYIYTDPRIVEAVTARHEAIQQRGYPPGGRMDADVKGE